MCNRLSERRIKYFEEMKNKDKAVRAKSAFWPEKSKSSCRLSEGDVVIFEYKDEMLIGVVSDVYRNLDKKIVYCNIDLGANGMIGALVYCDCLIKIGEL